ncbi:MAG: replication initiation protein, partial [Gammaproteobacteria bacterium]|nr:replication initiation protein [Gammaproteobacteria bacterium]
MDAKRRKSKEMVKESNANMVLKKHVGLIHCENKLTLIQRKICNILLFNALDKINDQDIFEIPIRKLCSLIGYNSNDSKQIKEAVKTLISTIMEWNLLEDSKFLNEEDYPEDAITWNASALLAGVSIKNGIIRYSYSPQMKSVLSSLDIYG